MDLKKAVVVITGAANGLGRALSVEFYRRGCHLALIDIDEPALQSFKSKHEITGQTVSVHMADVGDSRAIDAASKKIIETHGRVDVLVNNAGISISQPFEMMQLNDFRKLFEVNFWGTVYCTKYLLPEIKKQKDGRVVNIVSDFALMGFPGKSAYASSKSAIMGFTNSLKTELQGTGVGMCLVIPPPMATNIVQNGLHISDHKKTKESEFLMAKGMPIEKVTGKIVNQVVKGKYRILIGSVMFWTDFASRIFPTAIHNLVGRVKERFDFT